MSLEAPRVACSRLIAAARLMSLKGLRLPSFGDRQIRVATCLAANVFRGAEACSRTDRGHTIPLRPAKRALARAQACIERVGRPALHPLQQSRDLRGRVEPQEEMQVIRHDSHCNNYRPLLPGDDRQGFPEESGSVGINLRRPPTSGPHHVDEKSVMHPCSVAGPSRWTPPTQRKQGRFSDISRAVASATSSIEWAA